MMLWHPIWPENSVSDEQVAAAKPHSVRVISIIPFSNHRHAVGGCSDCLFCHGLKVRD